MNYAALFLLLLLPPAAGDHAATNSATATPPPAQIAKPAPAAPKKRVLTLQGSAINISIGGPVAAGQAHAAAAPPKPAAGQAIQIGGGGGIVVRGGGVLIMNGQVFRMNGMRAEPPPAPHPSSSEPATLHWKNGESLPGDIAAATDTELTWKTLLFQDPLQLRWPFLDRIDWSAASTSTTEPFGIALRDGSFLYGDLVSVSADAVTIHSARHGDTVLKRSEVLSVRRIKNGDLLFAGPTGDVGWENMAVQQNGNLVHNPFGTDAATALATGPAGSLQIQSWNRAASMDLALPDAVDIEIHLRSSRRPEFSLALGANLNEPLRLETWENELVLVLRNDFKAIRKIDDAERELALRVCWDKTARKCSVYTPAGELVTTWEIPGNAPNPGSGLVLQNKGLDLSLEFLRVRKWDGKPPAKLDPKQAHVELADGRGVGGAILSAAGGSVKVQVAGQPSPAEFPIAKIDALVFSTDPPKETSHEATLVFADGASIFGRIASMGVGHAALATSFTAQPLDSKLDVPRRLLVRIAEPAPEEPLDKQDKIVAQDTTLHGKLGSAPDAALRWIPVGGTTPSRPARDTAIEIDRASPAAATTGSALFYLNSGDILAGTLHSLDRTGAEFESDLMTPRKLPAADLEAIQFGASGRIDVRGFTDPGWQVIKGDEKSVRRTSDKLQMDAGTALAYPSLLQSSEIRFKYASANFSAVRLRLFCAGTDSTHAMSLLLASTGNQFIAGMESSDGQFENQTQLKIQPGDPVSVRLSLAENNLELFVNDVSVQQIPIDPATCAGSGLIIEPASIWGNGVFQVTLSDFSASSVPGHTWLPEVSPDIKAQVLTVPRFQKDDPPRHLLLAANGDVLRGEIEAATDAHFGFRCGLDELDVPRDRVKAVIWLKPAEETATAAPLPTPKSDPLGQQLQMRIMFSQATLFTVINFIKQQAGNLTVKLPDQDSATQVQIMIGGQTVGQAIGTACSRFGMHYHVDQDGAIVIEAAQPVADGLPVQTYWLKPDALPKTGSVEDLLTAKGITFPKGAAAKWVAGAGLLTLTDTADNQAKLAALLNSDFGGSEGGPTHWLLLTNGARFGLAVDKFEPDFITGHHPIYGPIKVPMAEVYAIRTTAPDPTATSRALDGWRLVNAPEPVIPDTGGDTSPLLGKDAIAFSLPLLAGGEFSLEGEKGHVVVLDFWATWCAPCIQSLPGLIDTIATFPGDKVKLIGIDQGEAPDQVKRFLQTRGLKLNVALDADQEVGRKYGADSIPRTVIVGPDGKVAWVRTGYSPDNETDAADVIKRLLDPAPAGKE